MKFSMPNKENLVLMNHISCRYILSSHVFTLIQIVMQLCQLHRILPSIIEKRYPSSAGRSRFAISETETFNTGILLNILSFLWLTGLLFFAFLKNESISLPFLIPFIEPPFSIAARSLLLSLDFLFIGDFWHCKINKLSNAAIF